MEDVNGVKETYSYMDSNVPEEPVGFAISESMIVSFLSKRGFKIIEHHSPKDIEKNMLTSKDGVFLGQTNPCICFVLASVTS
ncbi:MAG: hypothetical protein ACFE85_07585 [Candidatus Hodarchaeota archaeon]